MELFGIIFYVIIFMIIISAKKAAQSGNDHRKSYNEPRKMGNYSGQRSSAPPRSIVVKPDVSDKEKKTGRTFMEPHKEEKIQPRIRTNNLWGEDEHAGQRIVALRLMEGDPVPEGYVRVKCPYCGADNLVTKHCKQYHSCYFCRVPID